MRATSDKPTDPTARLEAARRQLGALVHASRAGGAETLREEYPDVWADDESALELVFAEYVARRDRGEEQDPETWYRRFPQWRDRLDRLFALFDLFRGEGRSAELPPGYELLDVIGQGSSAVVYKARQTSLDRVVAIKVLWAPDDERAVLRREAELAAKLEHPTFARVYEIGEWRGRPYLVMEYVGGGRVDAVCRSASHDRVAGLMEVLSRAVEHAHEQGVVHRDLKPANVLVAEERWHGPGDRPLPTIKIVDFGLAIPSEPVNRSLLTGGVAGTPSYMAPEQAEARVAEVGPRADVYSLGAMLYELLSGRPPFLGKSVMETLDLVRTADPVPPRQLLPTIPRDLETVALKCLRKEPDRRYASAQALADDLRRFLEGRPIVARPVSAWERAAKWVRRHPAVAVLSLALSIAVVAGGYQQVEKYRDQLRSRENELRLNRQVQANLAGRLVASARALWNNGQVREARQCLADCPEPLRDSHWTELHRLCHSEIAIAPGSDFVGDSLAVSPDGSRLAMHCKGPPRTVQVVGALDARPIAATDTPLAMHQIRFLPDGERLVIVRLTRPVSQPGSVAKGGSLDAIRGVLGKAGTASAEVVIWNLTSRHSERKWSIANPSAIAVSRDGTRIGARTGPRISVWDSVSGEAIRELPAVPDAPTRVSLAWDQAGAHLAVRVPNEIRVFEVATGRPTGTLAINAIDLTKWETVMPVVRTFTDPVYLWSDGKVVFAAPAQTIASMGDGLPTMRPLVAWDLATGAERFRMPTKGVAPRLEFSPDGGRLAILSNNDVEIHDARTGEHRATLRGHTGTVQAVQFSPDGRRLYTIASDKTLRTWDISPWGPSP